MLRRLILTALSVISLSVVGLAVLSSAPAFADTPQQAVCEGVGAASGSDDCASDVSLTDVIRNAINIFSIIIGIAAVVMIMVSGFKYVTAAGESGNITSAKQTLVYAIIGLVVAALAQVLVRFVLDNVK